MKKFLSICLGMGTALGLVACATYKPPIAPYAVDFNKIVEQANNELLLQNIVRGKLRYPMYFTRISAMRGSYALSANAGLSGSFPDGGGESFGSSTGVSYSNSPGFDYEILDSQEFYRGILEPISTDTFFHYLMQGWNEDMLTMLMVEKITVTPNPVFGSDVKQVVLDNNPDYPDDMEKFRDFVACSRLNIKEGQSDYVDFKGVKVKDITSISGLSLFTSGNWTVRQGALGEDDYVALEKPRRDEVALNLTDCANEIQTLFGANVLSAMNLASAGDKKAVSAISVQATPTYQGEDAESSSANAAPFDVNVVLRPIQGIIFYVGECITDPGETSECYYVNNGRRYYYSTITNGDASDAVFSTKVHGETYYIPKPVPGDYTMQSMALLNQLMNLQKRADTGPRTTNVRVVN